MDNVSTHIKGHLATKKDSTDEVVRTDAGPESMTKPLTSEDVQNNIRSSNETKCNTSHSNADNRESSPTTN